MVGRVDCFGQGLQELNGRREGDLGKEIDKDKETNAYSYSTL